MCDLGDGRGFRGVVAYRGLGEPIPDREPAQQAVVDGISTFPASGPDPFEPKR